VRVMTQVQNWSLLRARDYVQGVRGDSLVRNSLYLMSSTVVTAVLGYVFWIVAAHVFSSAQVGVASAVISLCSTVALLTYLGPAAMLIERLHAYERSPAWTSFLVRSCAATAAVTVAVALVAIVLFAHSRGYGSFFSTADASLIAVAGAAGWTVVNMYCFAFVSARRADGMFAVQGLVSLVKVLLVIPLCAAGIGARGIVTAWSASAVIGVALGALWLLPRLGLGGLPAIFGGHGRHARNRGVQRPEPRRAERVWVWHLVGQHLTSVGGAMTPLLLPILVVLRLGARLNAYFYITWMVGSIFFMVSPAISQALFAESVRAGTSLRGAVAKAFRVVSYLLLPSMLLMIVGGRLVLGFFGHAYVSSGYGLLVLLAVSAIPDAVSNIAVAACRATGRLAYSAAVNLGLLLVTATASWCLMPRLGLLGIGFGWLGAQLLGALASLPAFRNLDRRAAV
jgi:O-antigen/teichoic acid export membrane protein